MQYTKISPFDWYLLLETVKPHEHPAIEPAGEVKISIGGSAVPKPYSNIGMLQRFRGKVYLPTSTEPPSKEAKERFAAEFALWPQRREPAPGEFVVTYEPESDDAAS